MQYKDLGRYIKLKRESTGISLNKFAQEADVDCAILCRIENLKQGIKINILEKIANNFGKTPAEFLKEFEQYDEVYTKNP
ncbi:transcriptional regulator XRE family [Brachyspira sp. CAG:484]|nr:transcriptional regulator XRE family [Brachyspira sp. CAG:484]